MQRIFNPSFVEEKLSKIQQWLSPPDPSMNYEKALKLRQADTGLWFLESHSYAQWKGDDTSPLWLHGIPGCGKTVLSATILENVLQHCSDDPGKAAAYFYFDFNDAEKQDPELMLRSLIWQLLRQSAKIPASMDSFFSSCDHGQRPSMNALIQAARQIIQTFPHVYLLLDALDECGHRKELMDTLTTIARSQLPNLHLIVTSRREGEIQNSLQDFIHEENIICLQTKLVDLDIKLYVRERLSVDKTLNKWGKDPDIRQEIETTLAKGSQGM